MFSYSHYSCGPACYRNKSRQPINGNWEWEPFQNFSYGGGFNPSVSYTEAATSWAVPGVVDTRIDWKETPEAHVYRAELPGLNRNEVKVKLVDKKVLCISGEKKSTTKERTGNWLHVEHNSDTLIKSLRLPENAKGKNMKATMENGVLTVTVPKVDTKKRQGGFVDIEIQGK